MTSKVVFVSVDACSSSSDSTAVSLYEGTIISDMLFSRHRNNLLIFQQMLRWNFRVFSLRLLKVLLQVEQLPVKSANGMVHRHSLGFLLKELTGSEVKLSCNSRRSFSSDVDSRISSCPTTDVAETSSLSD